MSNQAGLPGMTSSAEHEADLREREDDPTPRGVTRAVLRAAFGNGGLYVGAHWRTGLPMLRWASNDAHEDKRVSEPAEAIRVLDVCAGYGCWASEIRRLAGLQGWPVHITAVEVDGRKRTHLEKWCDKVYIRDWYDPAMAEWQTDSFDLVIGNPHFSALTHEDPTKSMPAVLLRHAPAVLLLHQEQSFQKSEAGCRIWHEYPPAFEFPIPGSIKFRVGSNPRTGKTWGADSRCYQATLWLRGHKGPAASQMLPWLPAEARRWTVLPGTEDPSADLPAAPSWRVAA